MIEYRFDGNLDYGMWCRQTFLKLCHLLAGGLEKWAGIERFGRPLQLMSLAGGRVWDGHCDLFVLRQVLSGLSRKQISKTDMLQIQKF